MNIDGETKFKDLLNTPELKPFKNDLMADSFNYWKHYLSKLSFNDLALMQPTWIQKDIINGLKQLKGKQRFNIYSQEDGLSQLKKNASIIYLPAEKRKTNRPVFLLAGGAYTVCCTMVESIPVAVKLNELGYDCFCINYRTLSFADYLFGLFPKPLEDIAAAYRFIERNNEKFNVDLQHYYISGFSAGGHLAALWSAEEICNKRYRIPVPAGVLLGYPAVGVQKKKRYNGTNWMLIGMYGFNMSKFDQYNLHSFINENYPLTYIVHCKDDNLIDYQSVTPFIEMLAQNNVNVHLELGETGGHGFAAGTDTSVEGWVERAVRYLENAILEKRKKFYN